MELGNAEAIKKLVEAGLGLSLASSMSVKGEVRARALVAMALEPPLSRRLGVVRRRDKPESGAVRVLLSALDRLRTKVKAPGGSYP
jgi:DNA-binding transcriptional LysR family regulator